MDRRAIAVSGIVQGVGFRPFVHGLASRLGLNGFVRNQTGGVLIEVEGEGPSLDLFLAELVTRPPPLALIDEVRCSSRLPRGDPVFRIDPSETDSASPIFISPDVATCEQCLAELFDPPDRRFRYPFLNCTHCGPRLTIITGAPYDRARTTMASFVMCPACRAEYENPSDRRFHAQPNCCPTCGPRLEAILAPGQPLATDDPLTDVVDALRHGLIVALKGLGGYHLACVANDERAVAKLRRRKHRDEKPFAIMVRDLDSARGLCDVSADEETLLLSSRRPIVLLRKQGASCVADSVAPRNPWLGVMLPYTPLHHLLLNDLGGLPLVMTSGNQADEPIAFEDRDARERLSGIADVFLTHDRPIHLRCDDSVARVVVGSELPLRRSRGDAPLPLRLPVPCREPTLALGGQLKATFALGRGRHAFLSHHLGDLDHYAAYRAYVESIRHYEILFAIEPTRVVHDLHPDYASTTFARELVGPESRLAVQHHHAHMASCMAEHGLNEPVIGVTFDGSGFGTDGTVWGGEFLTGDYRAFRRAAHLRPVAMPGGEQAIREPWRMAAAYLLDAEREGSLLRDRVSSSALATVETMIHRRFNSPLTSSAGRLFDAVAALAGLRHRVSYEGQAAIELEWLAENVAPDHIYPFEIEERRGADPADSGLVIDVRPMIVAVVDEVRRHVEPGRISRRFHSSIIEVILQVCINLRETTGLNAVVLSGGVFMNALLTGEVSARLADAGFRAYRHRRVPPNDGGLSFGQLAIAAARSSAGQS